MRLDKNSLIIAICLSYLDFFLFFFHEKLMSITLRNVDCFNFKYNRWNKNSLIIALCLSFINSLLLLKQWMNINYKKMCTTSISIMRSWIKIEMWTILISSMRGWIEIVWLWLVVCLILPFCCSLSNGLTSITMRNVDHFNFKHGRMTEKRNVDSLNFKHKRLNKNSLIILYVCLILPSCCSLSNG